MQTLVQTLASSPSTLSTYAVGLATHEGEAHAASGVTAYAWLLVALPLLGAAVLLLGGRRTDRFGPLLATGLSWGSFLVGALVLLQLVGLAAEERAQHLALWSWIPAGAFQLDVGLLVDPLSMSFVMLITFVGVVLHVADRVHVDQRPDEGDQHDETHRQRVDEQPGVQLEGARRDPVPQGQVHRARLGREPEQLDHHHHGDEERGPRHGGAEQRPEPVGAPSPEQEDGGTEQGQRDEQPRVGGGSARVGRGDRAALGDE